MTTRTRLLRLVVSWLLVGVGVPMLVRADLGVAPFDVLTTGVSEATGWTLGVAFVLMSVTFFGTGHLLGGTIGWACLGGTVTIGVMVNVVLGATVEVQAMPIRVALLVVGMLIIATAICLVVSTELGPGPTEVVMVGLVRRGVGVIPARWIADGSPVVVGALLGGSIGVGTILFAVVMGPMVKFGLGRLGYEPSRATTAPIATTDISASENSA